MQLQVECVVGVFQLLIALRRSADRLASRSPLAVARRPRVRRSEKDALVRRQVPDRVRCQRVVVVVVLLQAVRRRQADAFEND